MRIWSNGSCGTTRSIWRRTSRSTATFSTDRPEPLGARGGATLMANAAATAVKNQAADASQFDAPQALTDGFQLVIDALKLNGIENLYSVPGIPISDLLRMAQAEGMRVISFRHEQNAGNAAAIAGFLTKKPGIC